MSGLAGSEREEHRRHDRLQLHLDAGLGRRLLDDGLGLLARRVDRGLVDHLEPLAVLGADAVGAPLPARRVEDLVGLVDVELPLACSSSGTATGAFRKLAVAWPGAAVDLLLDRAAVDQEVQRLADGRDRSGTGAWT